MLALSASSPLAEQIYDHNKDTKTFILAVHGKPGDFRGSSLQLLTLQAVAPSVWPEPATIGHAILTIFLEVAYSAALACLLTSFI